MYGSIAEALGGLLLLVFGILPGVPGETVYGYMIGRSWLEKDFDYYLRVLIFSVIGLISYGALGSVLGLPKPLHVLPSTFDPATFTPDLIPTLSVGYLGHWVMSGATGLVAGFGLRILRVVAPASVWHADAWDDFARSYVAGRWVIVSLVSGENYAGILEQADVSREPRYRDIVLKVPCVYDEAERNYKVTSNQFLYLRGDQVRMVSAISDSDLDNNIIDEGQWLFPKEVAGERQED